MPEGNRHRGDKAVTIALLLVFFSTCIAPAFVLAEEPSFPAPVSVTYRINFYVKGQSYEVAKYTIWNVGKGGGPQWEEGTAVLGELSMENLEQPEGEVHVDYRTVHCKFSGGPEGILTVEDRSYRLHGGLLILEEMGGQIPPEPADAFDWWREHPDATTWAVPETTESASPTPGQVEETNSSSLSLSSQWWFWLLVASGLLLLILFALLIAHKSKTQSR